MFIKHKQKGRDLVSFLSKRVELFPPTPRSRGRPIDQKPASEAIPEGELSAQVLPAVRGNALAHDDLVDKEVGEEVVAEPSERLELHLEH